MRLQAEVLILIKAYDDTFAQSVQARHSYRHDEFIWGKKFAPAFSIDGEGSSSLYYQIHCVNIGCTHPSEGFSGSLSSGCTDVIQPRRMIKVSFKISSRPACYKIYDTHVEDSC